MQGIIRSFMTKHDDIVGSNTFWSSRLLLYVLPTQNKSCLVLSCLVRTGRFAAVVGVGWERWFVGGGAGVAGLLG